MSKERYIQKAHKLIPDVTGILVGFLVLGFGAYLGKLLLDVPVIAIGDLIQLMIMGFIALTALITYRGYKKNAQFSQSAAYLKNAVELVNRARSVLTNSDGTVKNDRICWVTAARLITRAEHIATMISVEAHQKIFEAEHDYQRHAFFDFLKHNEKPLPTSFFFGSDFEGLSIGEAALRTTQSRRSSWIPPEMIAVIYRFFMYPEDYEDPLQSAKRLTKNEKKLLWLNRQHGVNNYLEFRNKFSQTLKGIYRLDKKDLSKQRVTAEEINAEMNDGDTSGFV